MNPSVFISHSSKSDNYARLVRNKVRDRLQSRGYTVLLDEDRLDPGDDWRAKLYRWLGTCNGAVILFSQAALRSDWVRKEATILVWRQSLEPNVCIVPALLGSVRVKDLETHGFEPLQLRSIQAAFIDSNDETEENAALLADAILQTFPEVVQDTSSSAMRLWVNFVAGFLDTVSSRHLDDIARLLKIAPDDWGLFPDRPCTLAYQLLNSDLEAAMPALEYLQRAMPDERAFKRLVELVVPVWVDPEAARRILYVTQREARRRLLAINGDLHLTGENYIDRATCSAPGIKRIKPDDRAGEQQVEEICRRYERQIKHDLFISDEEQLKELLQNLKKPVFVLLRQGSHSDRVVASVLERLRLKFEGLTFVLLSGPAFPTPHEPQFSGIELIRPELVHNQERDAERLVLELMSLAEEHRVGLGEWNDYR